MGPKSKKIPYPVTLLNIILHVLASIFNCHFSTDCECNKFGSVNSTHGITGNSTCQCKGGFYGVTCHNFRIPLENITDPRNFIVTCNGACKNIDVEINGDGDADLYAGIVLPVLYPKYLSCYYCFCSSIEKGFPDFCNDISLLNIDRFFFTAAAHIPFSNVSLTVDGDNLADVVEIKS